MLFPQPALYVTELEINRIRKCQCMICWRKGPSLVYNARDHGYCGWIGYLWPLCRRHRWEVQRMGWLAFLQKYSINTRNDPKDIDPKDLYR